MIPFRIEDAVEPRQNQARIQELNRLIKLYGDTTAEQNYTLDEAVDCWCEETKWRIF